MGVLGSLIAAALLALSAAVVAVAGAGLTDDALLPDLRQEPPSDISVRRASGGRVVLPFRSAVGNVGRGPLVVTGVRKRGQRTMTVDQVVMRPDGSEVRLPGAGGMRYTPFGHNHWHLLGFDQFQLRDASTGALVSEGHKVGFCLGSRFPVDPPVPGAVAVPAINHNCGRSLAGLMHMRMGIDVGWGDDYAAFLEFQYIEITHVPPGRYVVVHRADPDHRLAVGNRADDVASALIELTPPVRAGGLPVVRTLARCAATDGGPAAPCEPTS